MQAYEQHILHHVGNTQHTSNKARAEREASRAGEESKRRGRKARKPRPEAASRVRNVRRRVLVCVVFKAAEKLSAVSRHEGGVCVTVIPHQQFGFSYHGDHHPRPHENVLDECKDRRSVVHTPKTKLCLMRRPPVHYKVTLITVSKSHRP